jgi:CRP/FNR family transcriptional regulator
MSQKISSGFQVEPNSSAEERVAKFLLSISSRLQCRGLSPYEFSLPMTRQDIASYLGLASETISRVFSQLQESHSLAVNRRDVKILQLRQLQMMACQQQES